ncbi:MAG: ATP-binding cassette domain-containing protein [Proteocatella sp.]
MSFIECKNVSKTYANNQVALNDLNLSIKRGEFVYIIGPSGSGKSTILNLMMLMLRPDSGQIIIDGRDITTLSPEEVPYYRRSYGIISPLVPLMRDYNVYQNVALPLNISHRSSKEIRMGVEMALGSVGMKDKMHLEIDELSGGEQLKVSIARAIITDPAILIADEPTANLGIEDAWDILSLLEHINHSGTTVIMATHSKKLVDITRRRVVKLGKGTVISDKKRGTYDVSD